jgi:hypothetical protein
MLFGLPISALGLVSSRDKSKSEALGYRGSEERIKIFFFGREHGRTIHECQSLVTLD